MSGKDRERWDEKYLAQAVPLQLLPNRWLLDHVAMLPRGRALDLATGLGHSAIELARRGWDVTALDISLEGLERARRLAEQHGAQVQWVLGDLDHPPLPSRVFDLVTLFYFLDRDKLPSRIARSLRPGGLLFVETYTLDQLRIPGNHLRNPHYLLRPGELLALFDRLHVLDYREVTLEDRAVASIVAESPL